MTYFAFLMCVGLFGPHALAFRAKSDVGASFPGTHIYNCHEKRPSGSIAQFSLQMNWDDSTKLMSIYKKDTGELVDQAHAPEYTLAPPQSDLPTLKWQNSAITVVPGYGGMFGIEYDVIVEIGKVDRQSEPALMPGDINRDKVFSELGLMGGKPS